MRRGTSRLAQVRALARRGINEVIRVPGAAIPGILAPTIFVLGTTSVFGKLAVLPGFSASSYLTFALPVGMLQGAGFTGAATGVNLARDIEFGWFDRLLVSPAPRGVLFLGLVASAALRAMLPMAFLLAVGFALGAHWPGFDGLLIAIALTACFAAAAASWGITLALRFRTQAAAPLMQAGMFIAVLFTTAYAPQRLLTGWIHDVARVNPVTRVMNGARQGFVGDVAWHTTWPALAALAGLLVVLTAFALRGMNRTGR